MQAPRRNSDPARSLIMKILVRSWEYRRPRVWASMRAAAGTSVIVIGAVLCGTGYWWGALMMGIGALAIIVAGLMFALVTATA